MWIKIIKLLSTLHLLLSMITSSLYEQYVSDRSGNIF